MDFSSEPFLVGWSRRSYGDLFDAGTACGLRWSRREYGKDEEILAEGQLQANIYLVESGWGSIDRNLADGRRQIIDFAVSSDLVDLRRGKGAVRESFRAMTPLVVREFAVADLPDAVARSSAFADAYRWESRRRAAIVVEHLVNCGARRAMQRVAHFLLELAWRVGEPDADRFYCPITQFDMADALGLTPVHINRTLQKMRQLGLVEFRHGWVRIGDADMLAQQAGFSPDYLSGAVNP